VFSGRTPEIDKNSILLRSRTASQKKKLTRILSHEITWGREQGDGTEGLSRPGGKGKFPPQPKKRKCKVDQKSRLNFIGGGKSPNGKSRDLKTPLPGRGSEWREEKKKKNIPSENSERDQGNHKGKRNRKGTNTQSPPLPTPPKNAYQ